ncbi:ketopantoate hydroxymethyltransferase [Pisolithus orientalis]|uniref:ketopantoate hydroxymethyltransferase n=1 Tax=Pisolithus orientalis TaxID=936130 RepID=UPI0022253C9E|nr:ketopantoate hydroxymethyltransferase [Pisolithus orientalis]KAI6007789.1 ketopantoate hydroxymethyltransferase [Pisolithus orientalis]
MMIAKFLGTRCPNSRRLSCTPTLQAVRRMSVRPAKHPPAATSPPLTPHAKTTIARLLSLRASKTPITALTAYDYPTALACSAHPVDITLVGDSLAQVCLGYPSTTRLSLDEMLHHCRAVARGTTSPLLIADMPFGTYAPSVSDAIRSAIRMVHEGHVEGVKLEGGGEVAEHVRALTKTGIPVMAHIGLLPQRYVSLSGYRVQGRTAESASTLLRAARALEDAGAFSIVLEAIPAVLGAYITEQLNIPTIGVGAGPGTSGQVLVWDDMVGTWSGHKPRFVRHFADVRKEVARGVSGYVNAVKNGSFPDPDREGYSMDHGEWEIFLAAEGRPSWTWTSAPRNAPTGDAVPEN